MKSIIVGMLAVMLCPALATAQWTNEPPGSTTLLDCPFSQLPTYPTTYCNIENGYRAGSIATDSSAPVSPPNAFKSAIQAGSATGGSQLNWRTPGSTTYREMYVGLMWRTNPQFEGRQVGNKMFFIRGPLTNGVFLFGGSALSNGTAPMIFSHNTGGNPILDNSHACANEYGFTCFPNVSPGTLTVGTWFKLEGYIRSSTTPTSRDGIVRWWVNGVLVGNYTNFNYPGNLNEWVWTETWDGFVNPVPTTEWAHYIDHLHISIPNCQSTGCVDNFDNPPGPPGTTTVTVTVQ